MSKGYIGVTDRDWLMYLKENIINQEVNFWRKNTNNFKVLEVGEPFFFLVKNNKGIKAERQVKGYGIYKRFEVLDINLAWDKYQNRNGSISKIEYIDRMRKLFKKDSGDIGCIIMDSITFFKNPVELSHLGIKFENSVVSGKGIPTEEVNSIISAGSPWNIYEEVKLDMESEVVENDSQFSDARTDGKVRYTYGKMYERDPKNRVDAIAYHGTKCKICGFDFEENYGIRGKDFIEIHHINPLSSVGEEVKIDPKKDLIPVCSNCHRMIHRRKDNILSIEQMVEIVNKYKKA